MEPLTMVFAALFVLQTVIFVVIYRRAVTRHSITAEKSHKPEPSTAVQREENMKEQRPTTVKTRQEAGVDEPLHASALAALRFINEKKAVTSSDVSRALNLSREHTARLMKTLTEKGLVSREGKPFKYTLTEKGAAVISSPKE